MAVLPADFSDQVAAHGGNTAAEYAKHPASARAGLYVAQLAKSFTLNGNPAPLTISQDDPVFDLGGDHPNEAWFCAPLVKDTFGGPVAAAVKKVAGRGATADAVRGMFVAHRFLDAAATDNSDRLTMTDCAGVVWALQDGNEVRFVVMDQMATTRLPKQPAIQADAAKKLLAERLTARGARLDADLSSIVATDAAGSRRIAIKRLDPVTVPLRVGDGTFAAVGHQRVVMQRGRGSDAGGQLGATAQALTYGTRQYAATASNAMAPSLGAQKLVGIEGAADGARGDAPRGYVWGDPLNPLTCTRDNRDNCLGCCDDAMWGYAGAAATAVGTGLAAAALVPGAGLVAAGVGLFVGAAIIGFGAVTNSHCRGSCRTLYREDTGEPIHKGRSFTLTAAERDNNGVPVRFKVVENPGAVEAIWDSRTAAAFAWGGARIYAHIGGQDVEVGFARYPRTPAGAGDVYLRTKGDANRANNLTELAILKP